MKVQQNALHLGRILIWRTLKTSETETTLVYWASINKFDMSSKESIKKLANLYHFKKTDQGDVSETSVCCWATSYVKCATKWKDSATHQCINKWKVIQRNDAHINQYCLIEILTELFCSKPFFSFSKKNLKFLTITVSMGRPNSTTDHPRSHTFSTTVLLHFLPNWLLRN